MQNLKWFKVLFIVLVLSAMACNLPNIGQMQSEQPVEPAQPEEAAPAAPAEAAVEEGEAPPAEETVAEATPTPTLSHSSIPAGPASISSFITDRSTKGLAAERRANADEFSMLRLERPYTSESMDYKDYIDITRAELSTAAPWVYITIFLEGLPPEGEQVRYGAEFDIDNDGRGDSMVLGLAPANSDWTTVGVYVYRDSNNNVGGPNPIKADGGIKNLDGYDEVLFAQGYDTADVDGAWIRRAPSGNKIQLAVKSGMLGLDDAYMWGAIADGYVGEPAYFDYNDYFSLAEAGSPVSGNSNYPLKALALVDNTCRWTVGFEPTGNEPGLCYIPPTPTPVPPTSPPTTSAPGSISGYVYDDYNGNNARNPGEPGISGATVRLGRGACGSTGAGNRNTGSDGGFVFSGLAAGTYCVTVELSSACGGWLPSGATSRTVTIGEGEAGSAGQFGFSGYVCALPNIAS